MKLKMCPKEIDVRVSILPTVHGEKAVLRLLGSGDKELNLSNLGFPNNKLTQHKVSIPNIISSPHTNLNSPLSLVLPRLDEL